MFFLFFSTLFFNVYSLFFINCKFSLKSLYLLFKVFFSSLVFLYSEFEIFFISTIGRVFYVWISLFMMASMFLWSVVLMSVANFPISILMWFLLINLDKLAACQKIFILRMNSSWRQRILKAIFKYRTSRIIENFIGWVNSLISRGLILVLQLLLKVSLLLN